MGKIQSFKDEFTFEQRLKESTDMLAKYPDRVPVIAEKYSRTDLPELEKKKFLVPRDMSVGHFIHILSSRLQLTPGKALFVFAKDTLPQTSCLMDSLYEEYKDEDGFLYMCYSSEKTFGGDESKLVSVSDDRSGLSYSYALINDTVKNTADKSSAMTIRVHGSYLAGPMLFGHAARVWDCCISDFE